MIDVLSMVSHTGQITVKIIYRRPCDFRSIVKCSARAATERSHPWHCARQPCHADPTLLNIASIHRADHTKNQGSIFPGICTPCNGWNMFTMEWLKYVHHGRVEMAIWYVCMCVWFAGRIRGKRYPWWTALLGRSFSRHTHADCEDTEQFLGIRGGSFSKQPY